MPELRPYQSDAVAKATNFLLTNTAGAKRLYSAPTGSGKSYIELDILDRLSNSWLLTPKVEIIADLLTKHKIDTSRLNPAEFELAQIANRIMTPISFRNRLIDGRLQEPKYLIIDEAHHAEAETYKILDALCGACPSVGFTATPFRGSPKSTADFRTRWGEPHQLISLSDCAKNGYISIPSVATIPLVDDDLISVNTAGEFVVSSVENAYTSCIEQVIDTIRQLWEVAQREKRPFMVRLPTTSLVNEVFERLDQIDIPAKCVVQSTNRRSRQEAFASCLDITSILLQINVVSEGNDLPIRLMLDCDPCGSPVEWLQAIGRLTRPGIPALYYCTNRNITRHGYLFEGLLPGSAFVQSDEAFGKCSERRASRAIGLNDIKRFKADRIATKSGQIADLYHLISTSELGRAEYACIVHPSVADPIWAVKRSVRAGNEMKWGKWEPLHKPPTDLTGFGSSPSRELKKLQREWWERDAERFGLSSTLPTTRQFTVLPILANLRKMLP